MNSPVFGSANATLSGPLNSSTGNLLSEPTSLTNINSTNTIYGHHHRRFLPRLPNGSGRSNAQHPYGSMFYPEFEYRPPPPTYQASNQEYRLRMLLYERANTLNANNNLSLDINSNLNVTNGSSTNNQNNSSVNNNSNNGTNNQTSSSANNVGNSGTFSGLLSNLGSFVSNSFSSNNQQATNNNLRTLSPPPTYRSTGSTLAGALCRSLAFYNSSRPISRPPSYRSVLSDNNQANRANTNANRPNDLTNDHSNQDKMFSTSQKKSSLQDNLKDNVHRVTIHQTNTSSQVCTNGINVVAISSDNSNRTNENEVQILAHL